MIFCWFRFFHLYWAWGATVKKLRTAPFRAKVFDRRCWAPSGVLSCSPSHLPARGYPSIYLPLWCGCENPLVTFHLCLEYGHAERALPRDPTEMTSGYCALINQCICFHSFTLCLYTFHYYYPTILIWFFAFTSK